MPPEPVVPPRMPLGVYLTHTRETAIALKHTSQGVWYMTMIGGHIKMAHVGEEKFLRDFPLALPDYPIRKALKIYETSGLPRDEDAQKVLQRLLERL